MYDPDDCLPLSLDAPPSLIARHFDVTWALEDALLGALDAETLYRAPDPLRHPLIFYRGHTAAFFINKLRLAGLIDAPVDEALDGLFAQGVDPASADELDALDWPSIDAVEDYRARVAETVRSVIARHAQRRVTADDPAWALWMGLAHSRIHFETSSLLVRQLPLDRVRPIPGLRTATTGGAPGPNPVLAVAAGSVRLGRPGGVAHFGWDNEFGRLDADVAPFEVTAHLVSNAEYLEFVADGGFEDDRLWTPAGSAWRRSVGGRHPRFWIEQGPGDFALRTLYDVRPLPLDWPVEVNCHEAEAYCAWRGDGWRLPSEVEHHRLAALVEDGAADVVGGRFNNGLAWGSPCPVGRCGPPGGPSDVWGNVWQWLRDDFRPLPGFAPHRLYEDFSVPYFGPAHAAMIGGSWASTGQSASRWYRLWFRRHFYQHAGFRMSRPIGGSDPAARAPRPHSGDMS